MSGPGLCQSVERFRFEPTTDWPLVKQIVTHPLIYPSIADDLSGAAEDWEPIAKDLGLYLLAKDGEELLGLWMLYPQSGVCWNVHTCLLPTAWGSRAREAAKAAAEWVFDNTRCVRLTTDVPEYNTLALRLARNAGMKDYGFNPRSYLKDGKLWGIYLLGMSKEGTN